MDSCFAILGISENRTGREKPEKDCVVKKGIQGESDRRPEMKGYSVADGYMGYVDGGYRLFACERDYLEYLEEE